MSPFSFSTRNYFRGRWVCHGHGWEQKNVPDKLELRRRMLVEDERVELQELMSDNRAVRNNLNDSDKDEDAAREMKQVRRILASSFFLFGLINNGQYNIS